MPSEVTGWLTMSIVLRCANEGSADVTLSMCGISEIAQDPQVVNELKVSTPVVHCRQLDGNDILEITRGLYIRAVDSSRNSYQIIGKATDIDHPDSTALIRLTTDDVQFAKSTNLPYIHESALPQDSAQ